MIGGCLDEGTGWLGKAVGQLSGDERKGEGLAEHFERLVVGVVDPWAAAVAVAAANVAVDAVAEQQLAAGPDHLKGAGPQPQ